MTLQSNNVEKAKYSSKLKTLKQIQRTDVCNFSKQDLKKPINITIAITLLTLTELDKPNRTISCLKGLFPNVRFFKSFKLYYNVKCSLKINKEIIVCFAISTRIKYFTFVRSNYFINE